MELKTPFLLQTLAFILFMSSTLFPFPVMLTSLAIALLVASICWIV